MVCVLPMVLVPTFWNEKCAKSSQSCVLGIVKAWIGIGAAFGSGNECGGCKAVMPDQTFVALGAVQVNWDSADGVNIGRVRSRAFGGVGLDNARIGRRRNSSMTDMATAGSPPRK